LVITPLTVGLVPDPPNCTKFVQLILKKSLKLLPQDVRF